MELTYTIQHLFLNIAMDGHDPLSSDIDNGCDMHELEMKNEKEKDFFFFYFNRLDCY